MSSDNYYTIKSNRDNGRFYLIQGFMSSLEDGVPAVVRSEGDRSFESLEEAEEFYWSLDHGFMGSGYSEYGLIEEGNPLESIVTREQLLEWSLERLIVIREALRGGVTGDRLDSHDRLQAIEEALQGEYCGQ